MGSIHIVKASAGSGKTFQLTYEYIARVIETPGLYRNILAVTFTNKATEEMKQRIVSKLNELAQGCPNEYVPMLEKRLHYTPELIRQRAAEARTKILHDYSHFNILTIDNLFQRIIRAFLKELDIDAIFALELQTDSLLDNAIEAAESVPAQDINGKNKRYIHISILNRGSNFFVTIENSKRTEISVTENQFHTTKLDAENHGRGVRIIRQIVAKYDGTVEFTDKGDTFEVAVML